MLNVIKPCRDVLQYLFGGGGGGSSVEILNFRKKLQIIFYGAIVFFPGGRVGFTVSKS